MKTLTAWLAAGMSLAALPAAGQTVFVASKTSTPTLLGAVVAGQSYTVTATGESNLYGSYNGGAGLTFNADGIPTYAFPGDYAGFYPNGLSYDPSSSAHTPCVAAPNLCGALVGAFVPTIDATPSFYFTLGSSITLNADATGFLVGLVNDVTVYSDNGPQGFTVTLAPVSATGAVPEAATWAMMIAGFGAMGVALRRRGRESVRVTYA